MRRILAFVIVISLATILWFALAETPDEPPSFPPDPAPQPVGGSESPVIADLPGPPESGATGRLRGTVRRGGATVAARILVRRLGADEKERLEGAEPRLLSEGRAGVDGRFEMSGLAAGSREVVAVAADGTRASAFALLREAGPPAVVHIEIPATTDEEGRYTVTGTVVARMVAFVWGDDLVSPLLAPAGGGPVVPARVSADGWEDDRARFPGDPHRRYPGHRDRFGGPPGTED